MAPVLERPVAPPALSPGHGASLATTAGITAVITGVMAVGLAAQALAGGPLVGAAVGSLAVGAWALYEARNGVAAALDGDLAAAGRGLRAYHLGMAAVFAGLGLAALGRVALPIGGTAWLGPLAAALAAGRAAWAAWRIAT